MRVLKTIAELRAYRVSLSGTVGLVPTMGFLHEGHMSLVRRSIDDCDYTIVSIFVNPTQFSPKEDFNSYPRDTERDLSLLDEARTDAVFMPETGEMYPPGADTIVIPGKIADRLEGAARPGHFKGVATVVLKLFNLVQPNTAYFGQKDVQQVAVIERMAADLNVPVKIAVMPIIRESDGLAMSSRNSYLNAAERRTATVLYRSLRQAETMIAAGERDTELVKKEMNEMIEGEPLAAIDYVSIANPATLEEQTFIVKPVLVSLAVKIGRTRLIDNIILP